ncbi:MAG: metalloregulator ArsR/SmtB family transcription factor [Nocardioidaceae bacterium]
MSLEVSALRAVAHPVRLQILSLLTGAELSAAEVARELGITQANASYHLRVLKSAGHLVVASEEKIRGGIAKRYRHPWKQGAGEHQGSAGLTDSRLVTEAVARELVRRAGARASTGKGLTVDAEVWVPPEVWQQALDLVRQASTLVHENAQPPRSEGTQHVTMTSVLFEMSGPGDDEDASS